MFYSRLLSMVLLGMLFSLQFLLTGCGNNLHPSDEDLRPDVVAGTVGHLPTQKVADFSLTSVEHTEVSLSDHLATGVDPADVIVVYFTMWCSTCAAHTESITTMVKPVFDDAGSDVRYFIVDYVSGSVDDTIAANDISSSTGLQVLSDYQNVVKDQLHGGMGVTVVIDSDGSVFYNQDYGTGIKVIEAIEAALSN